mmetsp:Transcript_16636/g.14513  ORF Transcript_16636/g.14513 Transcript_16636/m.14513 type:complete len:92 (-) Transcript_16636:1423-1698(-)
MLAGFDEDVHLVTSSAYHDLFAAPIASAWPSGNEIILTYFPELAIDMIGSVNLGPDESLADMSSSYFHFSFDSSYLLPNAATIEFDIVFLN